MRNSAWRLYNHYDSFDEYSLPSPLIDKCDDCEISHGLTYLTYEMCVIIIIQTTNIRVSKPE